MLGNIKAGISTWVGIITGIALLLPPAANQIISYVENNAARFSGPEKLMAIIGMVPLLMVIGGRMAQAVAAILKHPAPPATTIKFPAHPGVAVGTDAGYLDKAREILTEHPEVIQHLRSEGVI